MGGERTVAFAAINEELAVINHQFTDRVTPSAQRGVPVAERAENGLSWAHSFVGPDHVGTFWIRDDPPAFGAYSPVT